MKPEQIKMLRLYHALSQRAFAEQIGLGESTVAKIENGWQHVSDVTKGRILRQFDVRGEAFIAFCERMEATAAD